MSRSTEPPQRSWAGAAHDLAVRVQRRSRTAAALVPLGWALLGAAASALCLRVFAAHLAPEGRTAAGGLFALGLLIGLPLAWRAARRVAAVSEADAAWALDRLAGTQGRGLAAAAVRGPAASEAAFAHGGVAAPPRVRLLPPSGWLPILAALILFAVAFLAPPRETASGDGSLLLTRTGTAGSGAGAEADASLTTAGQQERAAESEAKALEARAEAARRVRMALDLPATGPLDPAEAARQAADPERRRKAAEGAAADSALAQLLGSEEPSGESLSRLLAHEEDNHALAAEQRRAAAGARAGRDRLAVPAGRRGLVERYLAWMD